MHSESLGVLFQKMIFCRICGSLKGISGVHSDVIVDIR